MTYTPICCDLHDYIEIACVYAISVRVCAFNEEFEGVCITTKTDSDKQEWLVFKTSEKLMELRLDKIQSLHSLSVNQFFAEVFF